MAMREVTADFWKIRYIGESAYLFFDITSFGEKLQNRRREVEPAKFLGVFLNPCSCLLKFCEIFHIAAELSAGALFREIPEGRLRQAGGMQKLSEPVGKNLYSIDST